MNTNKFQMTMSMIMTMTIIMTMTTASFLNSDYNNDFEWYSEPRVPMCDMRRVVKRCGVYMMCAKAFCRRLNLIKFVSESKVRAFSRRSSTMSASKYISTLKYLYTSHRTIIVQYTWAMYCLLVIVGHAVSEIFTSLL